MPANNLRGIAHVNSEKNVGAVTIRSLRFQMILWREQRIPSPGVSGDRAAKVRCVRATRRDLCPEPSFDPRE